MNNIRSTIADYVTIFTGLFTLASGYLSLTVGDISSTSDSEWNIYLKHALSITVTFFSFYFFIDQSIRTSRRIVFHRASSLPNWLVYIFCCFGGLMLFIVSQIVVQSRLFLSIQIAYFIVPIILWFILMSALLIHWG